MTCDAPPSNLPFQAVKAAEEEKNKVRAERKRAAQEDIMRLEQVQQAPVRSHSLSPCISSLCG